MKKKHNRLTATLMLGATVGSTLIGVATPLTSAYAATPDSWVTDGFTGFVYAENPTVDGTKMTEENTPIVAWTNASRLTNGEVDKLLSGGAQGSHYPLFSELMQANGKALYCVNPFRMSPTKGNKDKGYDTTSAPSNNFGSTLYRAACHVYPAVKDVDGDGKENTILDRIVSVYTVWLAQGISSPNYEKNLNSGIRWDDIKNNFSNDKAVLGTNNGWILSAYKTLNNSDQAKVKAAVKANLDKVMEDTRMPAKPQLKLDQKQTYDEKTGVTKVTYTPSITNGFKKLTDVTMRIKGLSENDITVTQLGKTLKPTSGEYKLDGTKSFTVTVKPQSKAVDAKVSIEGDVIDAVHVQTFDAKADEIQNSMGVEPTSVNTSATLTTKVKESLGSMKVHKIDDDNKPLKGIEFGLYKDESLKEKVATGTTDANGDLTFDKLPFGTYYLAETKGDPDHSMKFATTKVTINSTDPNVQFTDKGSIVNEKKNIDIATILKAENNNQVDASQTTMNDDVEVTHLRKNATYRITDGIYNQETKELIKGSEVTGTLKTDADGKVTVEGANIALTKGNSSQVQVQMKNMKANLEGLGGKKVTANVKIERIEDGKVVEKANEKAQTQMTDPNQTATVLKPEIETEARGNYDAKLINPYEKTKITDKTKASNLVKGHEYKANLQLMVIDKDGKATAAVGKDKKPIVTSKTFTATDSTHTMDVEFPEFDSTQYAGKKLGIAYTLTDNDRDKDGKETELAKHNQDMKDTKEIVEVTNPTIETKALIDDGKEANVSTRSHISDVVTVKGLAAGQPVSVNAIAGDEKGNLLELESKGKKYNLMNRVNVDLSKKDNNFTVTNQSQDGKTDIELTVPLKQVASTGKVVNIEDAKVRQQLNKASETEAKDNALDSADANKIDTTSLAGKTAVMYEDINSVNSDKGETNIASHPEKGDEKGKESQSVKVNKGEISTVALVDMEGLKEGEQDNVDKDDNTSSSDTEKSTNDKKEESSNKTEESTSTSETKPSTDASSDKKEDGTSNKEEANKADNKKDESTSTDNKSNFSSAEEIEKLYGGRKVTNPTGHKRLADVMEYHNFTPGRTVDVSAMAMDAKTGKPIIVKDKDGKDCYLQGRLTFTPKASSGRVVVPLQQVRVEKSDATFAKETVSTDIVKANKLAFGEAPTNTTDQQKAGEMIQHNIPAKDEKDGATGVIVGEDGKRQVFDAETGKAIDRVVEKDGTVVEGRASDVAMPNEGTSSDDKKDETNSSTTQSSTNTSSTDDKKEESSDKDKTDSSESSDDKKDETNSSTTQSSTNTSSTDDKKEEGSTDKSDTTSSESQSGTIDMTQLRGKTITIFESVTGTDERENPDYTIASEANKDNKNQQFRVTNPQIGTKQLVNGQKSILRGDKAQLSDVVEYKDLAPNEEVQLKALELDKGTAKPFQTKDGEYLIGVKTFTPTTADGEETVNFNKSKEFDKSIIESKFDKNGVAKATGSATVDAEKQTVTPSDKKEETKPENTSVESALKSAQAIVDKYKDAKEGSVDHVILSDAQMTVNALEGLQNGKEVAIDKNIEIIKNAMNASGESNKPNEEQKADFQKLIDILNSVSGKSGNKEESSTSNDKKEESSDKDKTDSSESTDDKKEESSSDKEETDSNKDTNGEAIDSKDFPKEGLTAAEELQGKDQTPLAEHNKDGKEESQAIAVTEKPEKGKEVANQPSQSQSQNQSQTQSQSQQGQGGQGSNGGVAPLAKTGSEGEVSHNWFYRVMDRIFHFGK